ncbi:carbohydrate esterase family 9 protein (amidohydrolase) [Colletotrichum truncatum]|uniref:Carbohydrate esterase family 9 protein (Amidohydrolase) n=1 Tax=Colletotrichum truncatum TaxID=5467 RepID=A0ACC3YLC9_COLTU|nr:carbohydrate esterase family 9 protein (amidohydrolase) [Colletotrichum truncatum]KAF6781980.1 carbohydrate esterase family 9 protein (amidohydrolase) [Colletotrichum truncatum]
MGRKDDSILDINPPPYQQQPPSRRLFTRRRRVRLTVVAALFIFLVALLQHNTIVQRSYPTAGQHELFLKGLRKCQEINLRHEKSVPSPLTRANPRWNAKSGQKHAIVLRNATLFDGESILTGPVDIVFEKGIIKSIVKSQAKNSIPSNSIVYDVNGRFVTPGLVDIHSHHLELPFSSVSANQDVNEKPLLGPITPFVRAIDGFKPYDPAIKIIASGGVTSSLNLPGSGNIIGGQGYLVKNLPYPGENAEPVVEELLLEHGIPEEKRQRYLKMACGENPKHLYGHTRLGNVWLLRQHLEKAQKLKTRQDAWCLSAQQLEKGRYRESRVTQFIDESGEVPDDLELEATVALLRGEFNVNIHCYEPEDFERMLAALHEFGVHPQAFHHALEAWQVPEFLKQQERNITIATFAENSLFKHEAYGANLRGPKILEDHGVRVVLKSDHTGEGNHAKYLINQAVISHSFGLSEIKALQSVTSVAAQSIQQDHRIGFVQPGFDADLVIWDSHPLKVGATPVQVFVDGREVLDAKESLKKLETSAQLAELIAPKSRPTIRLQKKEDICRKAIEPGTQLVFTGVKQTLLDRHFPAFSDSSSRSDLTLVISNGKITCFDVQSKCVSAYTKEKVLSIDLENGYVTPGLVAFGNNIGILDIPSEPSTGDGSPGRKGSALNARKDLHFAKYGVHFGGRGFGRARVGGVTKAITAPIFGGGVIQGVSVGLRTSENATILGGGIWKDEVALHFSIGQEAKGDDTPTISSGIERLRQVLEEGSQLDGKPARAYVRAVNGSLPLVIYTVNEDDISQIILLKREFPSVNFVIYGGHAAPLVARELAEAKIPVILTGNRGAPDKWEKKSVFAGPPLSPSPVQVLIDAGVLVAVAVRGDSKVHGLAQEAELAAKFAGLSEKEAIKLVSTNFDKILGLANDKEPGYGARERPIEKNYTGDFVVWNGNPLRGEGSVVVTVQDDGKVGDCWPDHEGAIL